MTIYQSQLITIAYLEKERLIMPKWTGEEMNAELFMSEMQAYMETAQKTKVVNALWDHTHFNFQIPESLYSWIETQVNQPAQKRGVKKIGFVLGEDVMAQFSTMDSFEATNSLFVPRYFADPKKAIRWLNQKEPIITQPFEKEIDLLIEKNLDKGTAKIQIEVSLEQLPYYLKRLKDLFNHQSFVHSNYQKYMLLTAREREILNLITSGYSNARIAERLYLSLHTAITHRRNILKKLECRNIADLVKYKVFMHL